MSLSRPFLPFRPRLPVVRRRASCVFTLKHGRNLLSGVPVFPRILRARRPIVKKLNVKRGMSNQTTMRGSHIRRRATGHALPSLRFLHHDPSVNTIFFVSGNIVRVYFQPRPFRLTKRLPIFLVLNGGLVNGDRGCFQLFHHLLRGKNDRMPTHLTSRKRGFIGRPFFGTFHAERPAVGGRTMRVALQSGYRHLISTYNKSKAFHSPLM